MADRACRRTSSYPTIRARSIRRCQDYRLRMMPSKTRTMIPCVRPLFAPGCRQARRLHPGVYPPQVVHIPSFLLHDRSPPCLMNLSLSPLLSLQPLLQPPIPRLTAKSPCIFLLGFGTSSSGQSKSCTLSSHRPLRRASMTCGARSSPPRAVRRVVWQLGRRSTRLTSFRRRRPPIRPSHRNLSGGRADVMLYLGETSSCEKTIGEASSRSH